jgi:PKHD-type hydroxylase
MLLHVRNVLDADRLARFRAALDAASWIDGKVTAGYQSAKAKQNGQLAEDDPLAIELGGVVLGALGRSATFMAGALPRRIFPPLFNRYGEGHSFDAHIDNAVRYPRGQRDPVRTDLSATLFLSRPDEYDGGELVIEDTYGAHSVKLPAGDLVLYPSSSVHRVTPVTRGARVASFFWIQSLVRDDGERSLLFDLDVAIQRLNRDAAEHPALVSLVGVYHNLLRRWTDT